MWIVRLCQLTGEKSGGKSDEGGQKVIDQRARGHHGSGIFRDLGHNQEADPLKFREWRDHPGGT